jgi:cobalamin biosynthesis protein CbiG
VTPGPGIWPVRAQAEKLGALVAQRLGGELFLPWQLPESQKAQFHEYFDKRSQWVLVMATGIATRFVEGLLRDKHQDPAVVVLDEAARYAVVLLGGHEAGANALAYRVANAVGAIPVVTTATEAVKPLVVGIGCRKGVSEEQIERAIRHALALRERCDPLSTFAAAAAGAGAGSASGAESRGGSVCVGGAGAGGARARGGSVTGSGAGSGSDRGPGSNGSSSSGARAGSGVLRLGVGESISGGVRESDLGGIRELATIDLKAEEPGLIAFSQRHGIPLRVIAKQQVVARPWVTQRSDWVRQSVGVDGVCEPCALIACTRGRLVVPKTTLDGVAVAIVEDCFGLES